MRSTGRGRTRAALCVLLVLGAASAGCRSALGPSDLSGASNGSSPQAEVSADGEAVAVLPAVQPRHADAAVQPAPANPAPNRTPNGSIILAAQQTPAAELPPPTPTKIPEGSTPGEAPAPNGKTEPAAPLVEGPLPHDTATAPPPHRFAKPCKACGLAQLCKEVPVREAPKELRLVNTPPYVIQTPDILLIESPRALPDQPIAGEHLVRADGTVSLGIYGSVHVAGLTIDEAREVIKKHLKSFIREPEVSVDVYSYNSKFYYVITDGAGYGEQVFRLTFTGNETVLDAISQIGGLPNVASKKRIWIARPDSHNEKDGLILPVNWTAIAQCGQTATNYQIFPNDRLYIQSERLQAIDALVAKVLSPLERIVGATMLTGFTIYRYENLGRQGFGTGGAAVVAP